MCAKKLLNKKGMSFMSFVDVCFKSNVSGTMDTYNCETTLYGISDTYEEELIVTFVYNDNGLVNEEYNTSLTQNELSEINNILVSKYNDYCLSKVKVR